MVCSAYKIRKGNAMQRSKLENLAIETELLKLKVAIGNKSIDRMLDSQECNEPQNLTSILAHRNAISLFHKDVIAVIDEALDNLKGETNGNN